MRQALIFFLFFLKNLCTTTVLTLSTSGPLQTGRYVELTALMMFFQLSMMCRHLIFYPNLDRNGEKKDVSPDSTVIVRYEVKASAFLTGILKELYCHILCLRVIIEEFCCHKLFSIRILEQWFWWHCLTIQLITFLFGKSKYVCNPFWNSLKIPEEFQSEFP